MAKRKRKKRGNPNGMTLDQFAEQCVDAVILRNRTAVERRKASAAASEAAANSRHNRSKKAFAKKGRGNQQ